MDKTILITGVAGLLGSRLADWIIKNQGLDASYPLFLHKALKRLPPKPASSRDNETFFNFSLALIEKMKELGWNNTIKIIR